MPCSNLLSAIIICVKADYHLHTEFSDDSVEPMEFMIDRAIELGFDEICFTDHVDYGQKWDWDDPELTKKTRQSFTPDQTRRIEWNSNTNYPEYFAKLDRMRVAYKDKINIKSGLELGVMNETIPIYNALIDKYYDKLDFCLLSLHQIRNLSLWSGNFMRGRSQDEYVPDYYEEVLRVSQNFDGYECLAHLDLITRYDSHGPYPFEKVKPIIEKIFQTIIKKEKAIEINTSSWKYGLSDTTPCRDILKYYYEMGGKLITIGSDSHNVEHMGEYIDRAKDIFREIGFTKFYTFEKHKPIEHSL